MPNQTSRPRPTTERQTIALLVEVPQGMVRPSLARFLKSLGRQYGCVVRDCIELEAPAQSWEAFRVPPVKKGTSRR